MPPDAQGEEVTVTMDLPKGTLLIDGGMGGAYASDIAGEKVDDGAFTRYKFVAKAVNSTKSWGRIFIGGNWKDGQTGELRYSVKRASGETTPLVSVPLCAIEVPRTPQPEKIVAGFGWYSLEGVKGWPDGLDSLRKLGINTVSSFVHWMKDDDEELWSFWDQCAKQGFRRFNIDSTFYRIKEADGIYCQFEGDKHGSRLCLSYRGVYYQKEVQRVADQCARAKPSMEDASGYWKWGRLESVGTAQNNIRYLKFRDGSYWLKAGCDDPDFLGNYQNYNTLPKREAAIDYLADRGINSLIS